MRADPDKTARHLRIGLAAAILLSPVSLYLGFSSSASPWTKLPLIEPLLWLLFGLWVLGRRSSPVSIPIPAAPFLAFVVVHLLSFVAVSRGALFSIDAMKDVVQTVDYYLIFLTLLMASFTERSDLKVLFSLVLSLSAMVVVVGALQLALLPDQPFLVSSIFDDRNVMGCFLAVVTPLLFGVLMFERRTPRVLVLHVIVLAGILINSAPIALGIASGVIGLLARCLPPSRRFTHLAPIGAALGLSLSGTLSYETLDRLFLEPTDTDDYHEIIVQNAGMRVPWEVLRLGAPGTTQAVVAINAWLGDPEEISRHGAAAELLESRDRLLLENGPHVSQRYLEWQAALNTLALSPVLGVGLGRYQEEVPDHYDGFPKLNTLEPGAQNGFLVLAVTTGILGLSSFLWILHHLFALTQLPESRLASEVLPGCGDLESGISAGLWGALTSFVGVNIFYDCSGSHATVILFVVIAAMISLQYGQKAWSSSTRDRLSDADSRRNAVQP